MKATETYENLLQHVLAMIPITYGSQQKQPAVVTPLENNEKGNKTQRGNDEHIKDAFVVDALNDNIKVASPQEAERSLRACRNSARSGKLVVIADFDHTVTRCFMPDGVRCSSSHGVLDANSLLSKKFSQKTQELFEKYHPVEVHPQIPIAEKIPQMIRWYRNFNSLLLKERITKDDVAAAVAACKTIQLREGMAELIQSCQEANPPIPFIIVSDGLGDVIDEFLRSRLLFALAPSTMVASSNRMRFDKNGTLVGFSCTAGTHAPLHMFNKTSASFSEQARQLISGRDSCLLIGDGIGDLSMAEGLGLEELRVGFLNEEIAERLPAYLDGYHAVVTDDGPVPSICFRAIGCRLIFDV